MVNVIQSTWYQVHGIIQRMRELTCVHLMRPNSQSKKASRISLTTT